MSFVSGDLNEYRFTECRFLPGQSIQKRYQSFCDSYSMPHIVCRYVSRDSRGHMEKDFRILIQNNTSLLKILISTLCILFMFTYITRSQFLTWNPVANISIWHFHLENINLKVSIEHTSTQNSSRYCHYNICPPKFKIFLKNIMKPTQKQWELRIV